MQDSQYENISKALQRILDFFRGSTIAQEGGNDPRSKFWATYKKVSNEYDNDFLDRATDDMAIILTFAGLFSAVNSTFIVGTQPNPSDTTNTLMLQLIKVIAIGPDAIDINNLSTSSTYPPSTVWMQTLSYASLAFSVLAAFGAVMGKQWINSYKSTRGRGSLEERGLERQNKLEGLEYWKLETILGALLVLLQISLFLFGLSLSANMLHQEVAISSVIIGTMAFGMIFYIGTVLVAVFSPYSPFQSPGSKIIRVIFKNLSPARPASAIDDSSWRAVRWLLEISTNPDFVSAAGAMIPQVNWPKDVDIGTICGRLQDTFRTCDNKLECAKGIVYFMEQSVGANITFDTGTRNSLISDAFAAGRHAWEQLNMIDQVNAQRRKNCMADVRTALKMMVYGLQSRWLMACGLYEFSPPDEDSILHRNLMLYRDDKQAPSFENIDWLLGYLWEAERFGYEDTGDDVLIALSTVGTITISPWSRSGSYWLSSCVKLLTRSMGPEKNHRISMTDNMPGINESHLNALSCALSSIPATEIVDDYFGNEARYLRLIFNLTGSLYSGSEWCQRLSNCGHVERCNSLADSIFKSNEELSFYLTVILLHFDPSGTYLSHNDHWPEVMKATWDQLSSMPLINSYSYNTNGIIIYNIAHILPGLVEATRRVYPDNQNGFSPTISSVDNILHKLQGCEYVHRHDVAPALSALESLCNDLRRMEDETSTASAPSTSRAPAPTTAKQ